MTTDLRHPPTRNDVVFETLEPYLVAPPWHRDHFDPAPFGVATPDDNVIDPTLLAAETFLHRLTILDRLTFGPEGMPMPRWVFYSGSEMTGSIYGFAQRVGNLPPAVRERLELADGADGLMPLSMYIAIPAQPPDDWFGHNLASLNPVVPELGLRGLASITKAMALKASRCRWQIGATQWDSEALHIHTRFGPLELLTAWTPAHSEPATLTYRVEVTDEKLRAALGDPSATLPQLDADMDVAIDDIHAMQDLQRRIETGERFAVTGPPQRDDDERVTVPIACQE